MGSILYVGAHVDVYPLTCPALRRAYRRSPESKYWPPGCRGFDASGCSPRLESDAPTRDEYCSGSDATDE